MQAERQADAAGDEFGQRERKPRIAKSQLCQQPKKRQETDDLPQQREGQAGAAIADSLKKYRHHQRNDGGQEAAANDRKRVTANGQHLGLPGKDTDERIGDQDECRRAHRHNGICKGDIQHEESLLSGFASFNNSVRIITLGSSLYFCNISNRKSKRNILIL